MTSTISDSEFLKESKLFSVDIIYGTPSNVFLYNEFIVDGLYYIDISNSSNNKILIKQVFSPDCDSFVGSSNFEEMIPTVWKAILEGYNKYDKFE